MPAAGSPSARAREIPGFLKWAYIVIAGGALTYFFVYMYGEVDHPDRGPLVRAMNAATEASGALMYAIAAIGKFALGLTLGFLPCGLVYAALLKAVESAAPAAGALTMLAFGTGTAVALLSMGFVSSFAGLRLGPWSNRLAAISVMLFGAILLWRGLAAAPVCHG